MGVPIRGVNKKVGKTSSDSRCAALVKSRKPGANAAVWCIGTTTCYAQVGATGTNLAITGYRTCLFTGEQREPKLYY